MMRRALQLAALGYGFTSPNPMVGCVITHPDGSIAGEGCHRIWGGPHAEVNAVADALRRGADLSECTAYVTLEPCAHFGKTPPCAELLSRHRLRRVVIGTADPFAKVAGRGIEMLRRAGCHVDTGVLEKECRDLNRRFFFAHTHRRPWVILKWAQSRDGFVSGPNGTPVKISSPITLTAMHRERAGVDAIMAGTGTLLSDNPSLTCRLWPHRSLRPVYIESPRLHDSLRIVSNPQSIKFPHGTSLPEMLDSLYSDHGVISLMVEGGPALLNSFLSQGLWQEARVETSPLLLHDGLVAPSLPRGIPNLQRSGSSDILTILAEQEPVSPKSGC